MQPAHLGLVSLRWAAVGLGLTILIYEWGALVSIASAEEDLEPATASAASSSPSGERLLLLISGRIVRGRITETSKGYDVEQPSGRLFVPRDQVQFECGSLIEAYHRLRKDLPAPTAAWHMTLARWCFTNHLWTQARDECRTALELEPERDEARLFLQRIQDVIDPAPEKEAAPLPPRPRLSALDNLGQPAESLAGLSPEAARLFMEKVQPILMNQCSNTACHGPTSENPFKLEIIRTPRGSHRHLVQRNIKAVLQYVDQEHPERSPLLILPQDRHSARGTKIFQGNNGETQLAALREWVHAAAGQEAEPATIAKRSRRSTPKKVNSPRDPLATQEFTGQGGGTILPAKAESIAPGPAEPRRLEPDDAASPAAPPTRDPFDPDLFNRVYRERRQPY